MSVLLEVCVDNAAGLAAALAGGADRIELCSALALGGLTPTPGLMKLASEAPVPVYAMIRPHSGSFVFAPADEASMRADIDAARACGLAGVVLGGNRPDGALDEPLLKRLRDHSAGLGCTLHRAFDLVPDQQAALETAIDLGFERILTSGGAARAVDGLQTLVQLSQQAEGRISIMPGSGVRPDNVVAILRATHAREIHGSCSASSPMADAKAVDFSFAPASSHQTDRDVVAQMRRAINSFRRG